MREDSSHRYPPSLAPHPHPPLEPMSTSDGLWEPPLWDELDSQAWTAEARFEHWREAQLREHERHAPGGRSEPASGTEDTVLFFERS
jgi:hypothetical protein